jgi:hypothetical protein
MTRTISFPSDKSLGLLFLITRSGGQSGWWEEKLGDAIGDVNIPADANLHLLLDGNADLSRLRQLKPNDLQSIDFRQIDISDSDLEHLAHLSGLRYLTLPDRNITDSGLASLRNLIYLNILDLGATKVTDFGLPRLKHLTDLRKLYLDSTMVTGEGVIELNRKLTRCHIVLHGGRTLAFPFECSPGRLWLAKAEVNGQRDWTELGTAQGTVEVSRRAFVRLEVLDRAALKECNRLKPDDIQSLDYLFPEISEEDWDCVNRIGGLRELRLGGVELAKGSLRDLSNLQRLRTFQLTSCNISDQALKPIQNLNALKRTAYLSLPV